MPITTKRVSSNPERCIHSINDWFYLTIGCYSIQHYVIVCQWHATGCWFSPGTPVSSSTNKTDRHDIAEILLTMALNNITVTSLTPYYTSLCMINIICRDLIVDWLLLLHVISTYFKYMHNENMFFFVSKQ